MEQLEDVMAERLNSEPPLFKGCSLSEIQMLIFVAAGLATPFSIAVGVLASSFMVIPGVIFVGTLVGAFIGAVLLTQAKRNKPEDYYVHRFKRFLHRYYIVRSRLIWRTTRWDVIRSQK